jgi:predicted Zn-dependent protease
MRQNYLFLTICILTSLSISANSADRAAVSAKNAKARKPAQASAPKPSSSADDVDLDAPTEMPKPFEMPRKTDLSMADTIKLAVKGNPTLRTANLNYESSTNSYSLRTFQF